MLRLIKLIERLVKKFRTPTLNRETWIPKADAKLFVAGMGEGH